MHESFDSFQSQKPPEREYRPPPEGSIGVKNILESTKGEDDKELLEAVTKAALQPKLIERVYTKLHGSAPQSRADMQEIAMLWSASTESSPATLLDKYMESLSVSELKALNRENPSDSELDTLLKDSNIDISQILH